MTKENPFILHALSPTKIVSPFDINMAYDSGFDNVATYTNITIDDISDLVQDIIFSRHPNDCKKTGLFIAGEDAEEAIEMLEKAKKAMVPPFEISIFADPAGSFTTAAAMIACVKHLLASKFKTDLKNKKLQIVGAKGIVGGACAVIAAQEGAKVGMIIHREGAVDPINKRVNEYKKKYFGVGNPKIYFGKKIFRKIFSTFFIFLQLFIYFVFICVAHIFCSYLLF